MDANCHIPKQQHALSNQALACALQDPVKYPDDMSPAFKDFLQGLLHKTPQKRLTWSRILDHPFVKETPEDREARVCAHSPCPAQCQSVSCVAHSSCKYPRALHVFCVVTGVQEAFWMNLASIYTCCYCLCAERSSPKGTGARLHRCVERGGAGVLASARPSG